MSLLSAFKNKPKNDELPQLPLRELVLFPHTMVPIFVSQKQAIIAVEEALKRDKRVFASCRISATDEECYNEGSVARLVQHLKLPDGTIRLILEGEYRARVEEKTKKDGLVYVRTVPLGDSTEIEDPETAALARTVQKSFAQYSELSKKVSPDALSAVEKAEGAEKLANLACNALSIKVDRKITLLRVEGAKARLSALLETLELENEIMGIQRKITGKVKTRMDKTQREYILNEQIKEINKELGKDGGEDEFKDIEKSILEKNPPEDVLAKARKELNKLKKLQALSPEAGVLRGYLEWITDLPWSEGTKDSNDLHLAEQILDEDHFDMRKPSNGL
ncbi:hypothetical protein MASR2M78_04380 [Treponema sp.]